MMFSYRKMIFHCNRCGKCARHTHSCESSHGFLFATLAHDDFSESDARRIIEIFFVFFHSHKQYQLCSFANNLTLCAHKTQLNAVYSLHCCMCVCAIEFTVRECKTNIEVVPIIRYLRRHVVITIFEYPCLLFQTDKHVFTRASGSKNTTNWQEHNERRRKNVQKKKLRVNISV